MKVKEPGRGERRHANGMETQFDIKHRTNIEIMLSFQILTRIKISIGTNRSMLMFKDYDYLFKISRIKRNFFKLYP